MAGGDMADADIQSNKLTLSIEEVLPYVGEFGRFQKLLNVIFFIGGLPASYQVLIMYFQTITPSWRCHSNSTLCGLNGVLGPDDLRRCNMSRSEWYYIESKGYSLVTQFSIDCNDEWMLHLASSMTFLGWGVGAIVCGWIGDQYGRKRVYFPSLGSIIIVGFFSIFVSNIHQLSVCRFIIGFFIPGVQLQAFILIAELFGNAGRPYAVLLYLTNPIGWCILTVQQYFIRDWRILSIISTAPYLIVFLAIRFVPESIKWLHLHGKMHAVIETVQKVAKWNGKELPDNIEICKPHYIQQTTANPLDLFRPYKLALQSFNQGYMWLVTATCYYGLHMAANDFGGSVYRDFLILNLLELPAVYLSAPLCNRIGRKQATLIPLFASSLICIVLAFIPTTSTVKVIRIVLGIVGDFGMTIAFCAIYTWSVEIYPLRIRNEGMGYLQVVSHAGSAGAPWIAKSLKRYGDWVPFFTLGVPALVGAICGLWLPETKDESESNDDLKVESLLIDCNDYEMIGNSSVSSN